MVNDPAWDGRAGTAGGRTFGAALRTLVGEEESAVAAFAAATGDALEDVRAVFAGDRRVSVAVLARYAHALKKKPVAFLQATAILSLDVYATGLDPLYFVPAGTPRHDARIYMREINPRHAVPEKDMFVRNPSLAALLEDTLLDEVGKLELELAYLLRAAVQVTNGTL